MKEKIIYCESYKKWSMVFRDDTLPKLKHLNKCDKVISGYLLQAGNAEVNGEDLDYHDIRIFVKPKAKAGK